MAKEKAPAFQFYPRDFLTDERVLLMSHTERGLYITLLCHCWLEGSLSPDLRVLASMLHVKLGQLERVWQGPLGQCFTRGEDGRLRQKRLEEERQKQARFQRRQSDAAASRWQSRSDAVASDPHCPRVEEEEEPFSSTDRTIEISTGSTRDRARRLREELYPAWYAKHRNGARLRLITNSLGWEDAKSLVETWDDATLEKLAAIFLTTNDEWIASTDRGFRVFAMKASWCHDRLAQWEAQQAKKRPA